MKNTYSLEMEIEEKGNDTFVKIKGKCPNCMSNSELIGFIECIKTINDECIKVANERIKNGKIENKKRKR